jgi:hypothetical protein
MFLKFIEVLYHQGSIAHTKNYLGKNAYEYAEITSSEWQNLAGWQLGFLEIEATFAYSEMEAGVKNILCEYSKDSQRSLKKGFFAWIISIFEDWHNLKTTDRSRDVNEILKETLYESFLNLDDDILERSIEHQQSKTSRGNKSKLFGRLIDEVITPLRQSKLFALKIDMISTLEFYRTKLNNTEKKLKELEKNEQELCLYSRGLQHKIEEMKVSCSEQISYEIEKLRKQFCLMTPPGSESDCSFSPYSSANRSQAASPQSLYLTSLSASSYSLDRAPSFIGSPESFFPSPPRSHSQPIPIKVVPTKLKDEEKEHRYTPESLLSSLSSTSKNEVSTKNQEYKS